MNRTDLTASTRSRAGGGLTAGELAREAGLTTGAVTGVIDRLERVGYARRGPDPADRRKVVVEVTPEFYARAGSDLGVRWRATGSGRCTGSPPRS